ncbi:MAG: PD-(D/E)XK nuclease family protein [Nannocystis sp.]|nr:PD-(D/E)XK nuclease family protein [Nannocystis sp.]
MQRRWLDWHTPMLPAAAAWLAERYAADGRLDLRHVKCVLPGARAGRLLLRALIAQAKRGGLRLIPPQVLTPGAMLDVIMPPSARTASELECSLAWMHVLRESSTAQVAAILPRPPDYHDWPAWHELALKLSAIASELAAEMIGFTDVARAALRLGMEREVARWQALGSLGKRYRERLLRSGRVDPHERRHQALTSIELDPREELVTIGVVELAAVQRHALAAYGDRAFALIHAPEQLAAGFDDHGCVDLSFWRERRITIEDHEIVICERPADQAQAVIETIADFAGRYSPEQISIGLGDEGLAEAMAQAGEWADLIVHDPRGQAVFQSRPFRLLAAGVEWLRDPRYGSYAALLRHPDVEAWVHSQTADALAADAARLELERREQQTPHVDHAVATLSDGPPHLADEADPPRPSDAAPPPGDEDTDSAAAAAPRREEWLTLLDRYHAEHLSEGVGGPWLGPPDRQRKLQLLHEAISRLFAPLGGARRPLVEWFEPILEVLRRAYGDIETATSRVSEARAAAACLEIARALGGFTTAAVELQPEVDGVTAVRLALAQAAGLRITDDPRSGQIEMLGWLELHLDPSAALVIAGVNDGAVPQAVVGDAFLPDALRAHLGILSNQRRYARDAYLLEAIRKSRERITLVAGRASADGEPLTPSRLLLAGEREQLPARIIRLCDHERARRWALPRGAPPAGSVSRFRVPPASEAPRIESMSVTEFSWYLRCPYRYWLKYIKKLRAIEDGAVELDALQFGNITHEVLQGFGEDREIASSSDPERIAAYLDDALDRAGVKLFGRRPLPAIRIQLARLRDRLHAFSIHQARHRAGGWLIDRCEFTLPEGTCLKIPGQEDMPIKGQIDRIDRSERDGSWMIIDYKTSESGKIPEKTHRSGARGGERNWDDLQLPLYRHLAAQHGVTGEVRLAYMNLPKKPEDAALHVARWNPAELDDGIEVAREVVRRIRAGRFEMADAYPGHFQDDFANICQTRVFGGADEVEAEA